MVIDKGALGDYNKELIPFTCNTCANGGLVNTEEFHDYFASEDDFWIGTWEPV
jgi:hypothetical protein